MKRQKHKLLYSRYKKNSKAPDYSAQMAQQAQYAKEIADAQLAFDKQQYEDAKPRLEQLYDLAGQVGDAQLEGMQKQNAAADEQQQFWRDNYKPTELRSLQEANDAGTEADQAAQAGKAVTDARQQQDISTAATNRGLMAMGVNPNSGKFAGINNAVGLQSAANAAGAATNARNTARNQGIALRAGAVATGRGMQNMAGQSAANASNIGSQGVGSAQASANGNLGQAGLVNQGYGAGVQTGLGLFGGYANLQGQSNQINAQNGGSGLGGLIGTLGGAYLGSGGRFGF